MQYRRSLFGPLLLIAAGVMWLLIKSDAVPSSNLWALTHIWPFLLIAAGVGIILRPYWSYTSIALDVLIIGGAMLAILYAPQMGWDNPPVGYTFTGNELYMGPTERGSGNVISQTREVNGFSSISIDYPAHVLISQGNTESLKIEAEDNVLPGLKTEVKNHDLRIYYKSDNGKYVNATKLPTITIMVKDLSAVDFSSAGDLTIDDLKSDSLNLSLSGAGNIQVNNITTNALSVNVSGAGGTSATGTADNLNLNISGFGDFKGKELKSNTATINLSGAGSATVRVDDKLRAQISGAGSISYYGSPAVTKQVSGVGSVHQVQE
jgi:Putative auto-transporter adhesin, head GIN domain